MEGRCTTNDEGDEGQQHQEESSEEEMGKKYRPRRKIRIKRVSPMVAKKHQNPSGGLNAAEESI